MSNRSSLAAWWKDSHICGDLGMSEIWQELWRVFFVFLWGGQPLRSSSILREDDSIVFTTVPCAASCLNRKVRFIPALLHSCFHLHFHNFNIYGISSSYTVYTSLLSNPLNFDGAVSFLNSVQHILLLLQLQFKFTENWFWPNLSPFWTLLRLLTDDDAHSSLPHTKLYFGRAQDREIWVTPTNTASWRLALMRHNSTKDSGRPPKKLKYLVTIIVVL